MLIKWLIDNPPICTLKNKGINLCTHMVKLVMSQKLNLARLKINDKLHKEIEDQLPAIEKLIDNVSTIIKEEE